MGSFKQNFKEWLAFVKHILFVSDDIEDKSTTENQIKTINSCGQQLTEGDKRILADSLRDIQKIESEYMIQFAPPSVEKLKVQRINTNISKAIEKTKKNEEGKIYTNEENERI